MKDYFKFIWKIKANNVGCHKNVLNCSQRGFNYNINNLVLRQIMCYKNSNRKIDTRLENIYIYRVIDLNHSSEVFEDPHNIFFR